MHTRLPEPSDSDEHPLQRELEAIFGSVSVGDTTPDYWYGVIDQTIGAAKAKGDAASIEAMTWLKTEIQAAFREEKQFVAVSQRIAYRRLRCYCSVTLRRGRQRGRASHRRVGSRLAAKATAAGDPDPEPPRRRRRPSGERRWSP